MLGDVYLSGRSRRPGNYRQVLLGGSLWWLSGCGGSGASVPPVIVPPVAVTPEAPPNWKLVWQDEFSSTVPDNKKWSFEINCAGGGNAEKQCYTNKKDNVFIENGVLHIVAKAELFSGPAAHDDAPDYNPAVTVSRNFTSGRLRSRQLADFKYGRFEIRAKLPRGQGSWPAIWMLPTEWKYGGWASSGEIDIMEAVNLGTPTDAAGATGAERRVHGTLHYGRTAPGNVYTGTSYLLPGGKNPADDFHLYALEWEEGEIRWYVDNVHYATQRQWYSQHKDAEGNWVNAPTAAPFDQKFHLLLNLAVGGNWPENVNNKGVDTSVFPQSMLIDYVRVYECSIAPATGKGCATIDSNVKALEGHSAPPLPVVSPPLGQMSVLPLYPAVGQSRLSMQSYNPDGTFSFKQLQLDGQPVLHIDKTGANGNWYLQYGTAADLLNLSQWQRYGVLSLEARILSAAPGAELLIKIDSGWPAVSDMTAALDTSQTGWQQLQLQLSELEAKGNRYAAGQQASLTRLKNLLVLEPTGAMSVQLRNVHWRYQIEQLPFLSIFEESVAAPFQLAAYAAKGQVLLETVNAAEHAHGKVLQLSFQTDEAVAYLQSIASSSQATTTYDLSAYRTLSFDLKVVHDPRLQKSYMLKMDCQHPCSSGDFLLPAPADVGVWSHYDIDLRSLQQHRGSTLDLTKVDTPLVIFPQWGQQQGVVLQLDNVVLKS